MTSPVLGVNLTLCALVPGLSAANFFADSRQAKAIDPDGRCEKVLKRAEPCSDAAVDYYSSGHWALCQTDANNSCCQYWAEDFYCVHEMQDRTRVPLYMGYTAVRGPISPGPVGNGPGSVCKNGVCSDPEEVAP